MSLLVVALWLLVLTVLGRTVLALADDDGENGALAPVAGLVLLHLFVVVVDLTPLAWTRLSVVAPLFAIATIGVVRAIRATRTGEGQGTRLHWRWIVRRVPPASAIGWGDAVAALCLIALGVLTLLRRIAASDFIYHWGLKGEKFTLAGGIDLSFLAAPWNGYLHPDYPNLVPELFAVTALTQGRFAESTVLLWSVVATGLVLLCARSLLSDLLQNRRDRQAGLAILALGTTSFTISWQMTGNADAWLALAALLLTGALLRTNEPSADGTDLTVGIAAALAAAVKTEGVVLAGLALLLHLGRRWSAGGLTIAAFLRAALPPAIVVLPWAAMVWAHQLAQSYTRFSVDAERITELPAVVADSLLHDGWHGLSLVALALVFILPFFRRIRLAAILLATQLGFYIAVYLTTTGDMEYLIRTTAPRLVFHLLPAALVLGMALLGDGAWSKRGEAKPAR